MIDIWTRVYRAFDPLMPLKEADLETLYAERNVSIASDISDSIRMSESAVKVVLTGQRGSGKTTELRRVTRELKDEFFPAWLDVESRLDLFNINHLEVLIGTTVTMYKTAEEKGITLDTASLDRITETIQKVTRKRNLSIDLSAPKLLEMAVGTFKLGLNWETAKDINVEPEVSDILAHISESVAQIQATTGYLPLWIVDGLDKVEFDMAKKIFAESSLLARPPCPIIYTVPFALSHSPQFEIVKTVFSGDVCRELPNVLLFTREGERVEDGFRFFEDLVAKRLQAAQAEGFIESQALRALIQKSGGVVRELIYLVRYGVQEAKRRKIERIDLVSALAAIDRFKKEKVRGLDSERLTLLCQIYRDRPQVLPSEGIREEVRSELQATLYILYYEDGGQWYWTHPVLEDFLEAQCPKKNQ
ncbi:MAG: hypothetical protein HY347_02150 [candidate division NC10 bacterium]|nr:hypothetical protein [candidate division NC10 bacterium]